MSWIGKALKWLGKKAPGSHRQRRRGHRRLHGRAPDLEACERRQLLSVLFDPDGGEAGNAPVQIEGLDFSVGNALAIGGNQAVANFIAGSGPTTFQVRYQATLAGYINQAGVTIVPPGLNATGPGSFEVTVAALFYEQVTDVSNTGTIATASFVPAMPPTGGDSPFFEVWFDNNPSTFASNLEGTGFRDGVKILEGAVANASGNFTTNIADGAVIFDQFLSDDYNGLLSVSGIGGTSLTFNIVPTALDPAFFQTHITALAFGTSNKLPFSETNPSRLFFGTAPNLGAVNGASPITPNGPGGPDVQFQSDGGMTFTEAAPGIAIRKATNGQDAATLPGPSVPLGDPVTFTYDVTNTGNEPLANVVVIDDAGTPNDPSDDFMPTFTGGDTNGNGILEVNETWTYAATRPAHLLLGTANPCQYTNRASVTGNDPFGVGVTGSDVSNHTVLTSPGIAIAKMVNGQAADAAPGPVVDVGSTVTFTYTICNTGDVPLSGVTVTDDAGTPSDPSDDLVPTLIGGDANNNGVLDVGETWTYETTATATAGQYANTALVTGTDPCNTQVSDSALGHYFGMASGIAITKTTQGPPVSVVDLRRYGFHQRPTSLILTFSGDLDPATAEDLANYQLIAAGRDRRFGTADDQKVPLGTADYDPATRTVTLTPQRRFLRVFENYYLVVSTAPPNGLKDLSGNPIDGNGDGQAGGDYTILFGPRTLRLAKAPTLPRPVPAPPAGAVGPIVTAGSAVQFHYEVRNTGGTPLANVTVMDDAGTPNDPADDFRPTFTGGDTNNNGQLDVGEVWTYVGQRAATAGQYVNIVTVTGTTPSGSQATNLATSAYFGVCPSVVDLVRHGVHHQPAEAILTFNAPLDPATAQDLSHYSLVASGPDQQFGTADDRPIPLRSAVYDPLQWTVTLTAARPLNVHGLYQVTASDLCASGTPFVGLLNRKYSLGLELPGRDRFQTGSPTTTPVRESLVPGRLSARPGGPQALLAKAAHLRQSLLARRRAS